jgi:hypothetical protein
MYSGVSKTTEMPFETFKNIIDENEGEFELQLEGGEPLLNKNIYLFIEYAISTNRCKKVIVLSNGIVLKDHIKRLVDLHKWYDIPFEVKVSVNYWLLKVNKNHLKNIAENVFATEYIPNFNISLNTRKRKDDEWIDDEIAKYNMANINNSFYLQSYGKMTGNKNYDGVVIVQNIENWKVYSVDGQCFGTDLVARSEHEKGIN